MDAPALPTWLSAAALTAAARMHASLVVRGAWRPEFERALGLAAHAAARYADLAARLPADHPAVLAQRQTARRLAAELRIVDHPHLGLVDGRGRDVELLALVAPPPAFLRRPDAGPVPRRLGPLGC